MFLNRRGIQIERNPTEKRENPSVTPTLLAESSAHPPVDPSTPIMSPVSGTPTVISASVCGKTAEEMDEERLESDAYQYLCHLEEARLWLGGLLPGRDLPPTGQFEEHLRNGVCLALLGHAFAPDLVPLKRIFDVDESRFRERGLHFRHTDNINYFLQAIKHIGLPEVKIRFSTPTQRGMIGK